MKNFYFLTLVCFSVFSKAQFVTPGNGETYTLSSLSTIAPNTIIQNGNEYTMLEDIQISLNDAILINESDVILKINEGKQLSVYGRYETTASNVTITSGDATKIFRGILFGDEAEVELKNTIIEYGGGIRVSTSKTFLMENCTVRYFKNGLLTSSTIMFSRGTPIVRNSQFIENDYPAFSSGANQEVSATFENNYLYKNSKTNANRPQINMGPSGPSGITTVSNNTIIGDLAFTNVGGISVSTLLGIANNVIISGNTIKDNRYGITIAGNNSSGKITNNIIENNIAGNAPMTGSSGISLSGNTNHIMNISIRENIIRKNLWGITLIGNARADLGTETEPGKNIFRENGNNGSTYALYNNTPNAISAQYNCWIENENATPEMVEDVIFHQSDDTSKGLVTYTPFNCASSLASSDVVAPSNTQVYPNPNYGDFYITTEDHGNINIYDWSGTSVFSQKITKGKNTINTSLPSGTYIIKIENRNPLTKTLIIK